MLALWMAYATLLTTLLVTGGVALEACARLWSTPRRVGWFIVLVTSIVAPAVLALRPTNQAPAIPLAIASRPSISRRALPPASAHPQTPPELPARQPLNTAALVLQLTPYVVLAWLAVSVALLALFALSVFRLRIQSRSWRDTTVDGIPVFVSRDIGPAVIGTLRPRIVVAEWTLALDPAKRALMLCHELEHIRARDPLLLRLAALSLFAFPWNAPLWFLVRRLRESIEIDCDSRVLGAVQDSPRDYGMLLLLVGARRAAPLPTAVGFTGYPPFLERRIKAMTSQPPRRRMLLSLGLLSLTVASTIAATRAPVPPSLRSVMHQTAHRSRGPSTGLPRRTAASSPSVAPQLIASTSSEPTSALASTAPIDSLPPLMVIDTNPPPARDEWTPNALSFQLAPQQAHAGSRQATGRVLDSASNSPLANVYVTVVGIQALNEPNWTCSDANGVFSLRVPVGEAWLSAQSADHAFSRFTLAPADSFAVLRGAFVETRPVPPGPVADRVLITAMTPIRSVSSPLIIIDGVPQPSDSVHLTIHTVRGGVIETDWNRRAARPRFFIDGVELDWNSIPIAPPNPCAK